MSACWARHPCRRGRMHAAGSTSAADCGLTSWGRHAGSGVVADTQCTLWRQATPSATKYLSSVEQWGVKASPSSSMTDPRGRPPPRMRSRSASPVLMSVWLCSPARVPNSGEKSRHISRHILTVRQHLGTDTCKRRSTRRAGSDRSLPGERSAHARTAWMVKE